MQKESKVSTIIPTYKRADMIARAVDSILNQTYKNVEVIVVDDNNPDTDYRRTTEAKMKDYEGDSRVKYIKHNKNRNGSVARNTGIRHATGKYLCFLDDDDYFFPLKIEKQVKYLKSNPEYKAVYCGWKVGNRTIHPYRSGDLTYEQFIGNNIIDTNMIMIEKNIVEVFGGWDERLKRNQDVAFILRYFNLGEKIGLVKEALVFIDLADRSNVANSIENEKNFDVFFKYYYNQLMDCDRKYKNAKKEIYSSRYRGVLFNYLKNKNTVGAIKLYIKMMKIAPIVFNKFLLNGLLKKLQGKPLYSYESNY
ncbi:glycosyltransferase family 2 protein [Halobacillus sp. B23F22_1]|uniref:glycosyltransferase family 2 protein n=1 Tax=Halobacillus sp. B23F22_1 TaxID=3459514 RepID=UPI00373F4CDB